MPDAVSQRVRDAAIRIAVPSVRPVDQALDGTLTLAGPLSSPSGIGENARLVAEGLADIGYKVGLIDLTGSLSLAGGAVAPQPRANLRHGEGGGPLLVHLNPPDFQKALLLSGVATRNRRVIGYWVWELGIVPPVWRKAFRLVHEIWVPTSFVAAALRASGWRGPLRVIAPPLAEPCGHFVTPAAGKALALRVLTVFAYDSGFHRKNPLAAIAAFRQAFGERDDVELVLKLRGRSASGQPEQQFAAAVAGCGNIRVIDATVSREAYLDLLRSSDVLLSMHRSEGLGLPLAEAMFIGKPVVATGWSGNLDFMTKDTACLVPSKMIRADDEAGALAHLDAEWADPSVDGAADWLRRLLDPQVRAAIGSRARSHVTDFFGLQRFASRLREGDVRGAVAL